MYSVNERDPSTFSFRGTISPLLQAPSAVMTNLACASLILSAKASDEKPPKTTE